VVRHIEADQISLTALGSWTSPHTGATWPSGWRVQIAQIGLDVTVTPELADQESQHSREHRGHLLGGGELGRRDPGRSPDHGALLC